MRKSVGKSQINRCSIKRAKANRFVLDFGPPTLTSGFSKLVTLLLVKVSGSSTMRARFLLEGVGAHPSLPLSGRHLRILK